VPVDPLGTLRDMTPEAVLAAIRAGFEFGTELCRFLQTPEGQRVLKQSREDRAAWDAWWQRVETDFTRGWAAVIQAGK